MTRFTKAQLAAFAGSSVDDLLGDEVRLLIVGINPGLWTAAVNAHFARPGNRFWPALHAAGITPHRIDASAGMAPADAELLRAKGIGITNISPIATARADELTREQLRAGAERLTALVERLQPRVVAVLGISAYRLAFGRPATKIGPQPQALAGCELWVLPNPSGLNAHATPTTLAQSYAQAADAAGISRSAT
ncbi:MAG: mismatch-specific DNA-glycosylase [Acidimicrobiales bacterium]